MMFLAGCKDALAFARRFWWLGLVVLCAFLWWRGDLAAARADKWEATAGKWQTAYDGAIDAWSGAQSAANTFQSLNNRRVAAEQATIDERTAHDYEVRLAAADDRLERVRGQLAARADLRSSDPVSMSVAREATCEAYAGTSCDGLLAKLHTAERQAANLIDLRNWAEAQSRVQVNPVPVSGDPVPEGPPGVDEAKPDPVEGHATENSRLNPE